MLYLSEQPQRLLLLQPFRVCAPWQLCAGCATAKGPSGRCIKLLIIQGLFRSTGEGQGWGVLRNLESASSPHTQPAPAPCPHSCLTALSHSQLLLESLQSQKQSAAQPGTWGCQPTQPPLLPSLGAGAADGRANPACGCGCLCRAYSILSFSFLDVYAVTSSVYS